MRKPLKGMTLSSELVQAVSYLSDPRFAIVRVNMCAVRPGKREVESCEIFVRDLAVEVTRGGDYPSLRKIAELFKGEGALVGGKVTVIATCWQEFVPGKEDSDLKQASQCKASYTSGRARNKEEEAMRLAKQFVIKIVNKLRGDM